MSRTEPTGGGKPKQDSTSLRILTYNVLSPDHADWVARRPVIQAGIDALDPDVIDLQEDTGFLETVPAHRPGEWA